MILLLLIGGGVVATTHGLSSIEPALPEFDRATSILAEVQKGTMIREVRGPGTLVPQDVTYVTTEVGGTIAEVLIEPGAAVAPDTVLLRLNDPQMERALRAAQRSLDSALADVERFKLQQKSQQLDLKVSMATARANYEDARSLAETNKTLARRGLISQKQWEQSREKADRSRLLRDVQLARAQNSVETESIQLKEKEALVDVARDQLAEQQERQAALVVNAGVHGVLQRLGVNGSGLDVGQRVGVGSAVAMISDPTKLKAVLQISQTQARDVVEGQQVQVDTRNGLIEGRVSRVDPAVQNDRVAVEVELAGELPVGARPELSVDGMIEVSRLDDVFHVRKPVYSQENGRLEVFRLEPDGETVVRTTVEFGITSVHTIQVVTGLEKGDQIVVSDTTRWKAHDRVKLK